MAPPKLFERMYFLCGSPISQLSIPICCPKPARMRPSGPATIEQPPSLPSPMATEARSTNAFVLKAMFFTCISRMSARSERWCEETSTISGFRAAICAMYSLK